MNKLGKFMITSTLVGILCIVGAVYKYLWDDNIWE